MIRVALATTLLSLVVQWIVLVQCGDDPTLAHPIIDSATYHRHAASLAAGDAPGGEAFFQPPLYPYALSLVYRAGEPDPLVARGFQIALGAMAAGLTAILAWSLYGRTVALVAGVLVALHGPLVFFHARLLPAGLATLLDLAGILLLIRALRSGRALHWLAAGLAFGLAGITVANALAVPVVAGLAALVVGARTRSPRPLLAALALAGGTAAAVAPVTWHNLRESSEAVLVSTNAGINLWIGNNPAVDRTTAIRPGYEWTELQREAVVEGARTSRDMDRWFRDRVARWARTDPAAFLAGLVRKTWHLLSAREIPRNLDLDRHAALSPVLSALTWHRSGFALPASLLIPFAAWGILATTGRAQDRRALVAFVLVYGATVVLFFPTARYRLPLAPAACVLAAAGAVDLVRTRRRPAARGAIVATVAVAAVLASRFVPVRPGPAEYRADVLRLVALERLADGAPDDAVLWLERSLEVLPGSADTYNYLAAIRLGEGRPAEALAAADAAVTADPGHAESWLHRALALVALDRSEEAGRAAEAAVRARPSLAPAWALLADLAWGRGDLGEALEFGERALQLDPGASSSLARVARVLAADEAANEASLQRAVALARAAMEIERATRQEGHARPETLEALAGALARLGEPGRAARVLDRAISFEPDPARRAELERRRAALGPANENGAALPDGATPNQARPD